MSASRTGVTPASPAAAANVGTSVSATKDSWFSRNFGKLALAIYLILLMLPIYWMLNMSLRPNAPE